MEKSAPDNRHEEFRKIVDAQENSGLTQKAFCEKNGIVLSHFVYYRCLFKKQSRSSVISPAFSPVRIVDKEKFLPADIRISLPNGFSCQIPHDFSAEKVKQLMQALLSC